MFYPDNQEMTLYRHNGRRYVSVKPDEHGRCALPELELEMGILDGWVRYWFRGELLPLPADLQRDLDQALRRADDEKRRADDEKRRADDEKRRADELQTKLGAAECELAELHRRPAPRNLPRPEHRPLFPRRRAPMSPDLPRVLQELAYEREAQAYLKRLPPEHFMEATPQATQARSPSKASTCCTPTAPTCNCSTNCWCSTRQRRPLGQVVPDNMVVLTTEAVRASTSYNVALEPAPPFWMLEYVSKNSERKDYEDSFKKYERELKVPYYLMFCPDNQEMTLYRHNGRRYVSVKPDEHGRCAPAGVGVGNGHPGWLGALLVSR